MTFPYSSEYLLSKECRFSGEGYIHCTQHIRDMSKALCKICPSNPKNKDSFKNMLKGVKKN